MKFLLITAEFVKRITLASSVLPEETVFSTSFLKELFLRRCRIFNVWGSVAKITQDQVEELVQVYFLYLSKLKDYVKKYEVSLQFFLHREHKVCLTMSVSEPVNNAQIGEYTVEMTWNRFVVVRDLVIKHFGALQYEQNWW